MAKTARPKIGIGGGKLAMFEVLQGNAQDAASSHDAPAIAGARPREAAPAPSFSQPPAVSSAYTSMQQAEPAPRGSGFGGAIVLGVSLLAIGVGATAFFVGRLSADSPADNVAAAADLDQPMPEVLGVGGQPVLRTSVPAASADTEESVTLAAPSADVAAALSSRVKRSAGRNYVLIQSYAKSERAGAEATVAALHSAGIGATIETDIKGWPNRLCVFGTEAFDYQKNNPVYQQYVANVLRVGRTASKDRLIKRFDPQAVQWGR